MYEQFFELSERPFDLTPNPKFLVLTDSHREVLRNLEYGIASRKGLTVLIGEAGSGKTTMIRSAIARQSRQVHCVHLHNPTLSRAEFVETLAYEFGLTLEARTSKAAMLRELGAMLKRQHDQGESTVLIVDEAQSLPLDLLEEIRLLANIETDSVKLITLIIAGQPELADRLNEQSLRQLKQRVALRCELRPLTFQETAGYIAGRVKTAGGVAARVFTLDAVKLIHERSRGIPRLISVLSDNSLLGGFAAGQRPVGASIVREVSQDFDLGPKEKPLSTMARPSDEFLAPLSTPAPASPAVKAGGLLGIADYRPAPPPAEPNSARPEAEPGQSSSGLFRSLATKSKRFSFFWS